MAPQEWNTHGTLPSICLNLKLNEVVNYNSQKF